MEYTIIKAKILFDKIATVRKTINSHYFIEFLKFSKNRNNLNKGMRLVYARNKSIKKILCKFQVNRFSITLKIRGHCIEKTVVRKTCLKFCIRKETEIDKQLYLRK